MTMPAPIADISAPIAHRAPTRSQCLALCWPLRSHRIIYRVITALTILRRASSRRHYRSDGRREVPEAMKAARPPAESDRRKMKCLLQKAASPDNY
jgi:hypothetical protein